MSGNLVCIRYVGKRAGSAIYTGRSNKKYLFGQNPKNATGMVRKEDEAGLLEDYPRSFIRIPQSLVAEKMELQAAIASVTKLIEDEDKEKLIGAGLVTVGQVLTLSETELSEIGIADPDELLYQIRFRFKLVNKRPAKKRVETPKEPEPDSKTGEE